MNTLFQIVALATAAVWPGPASHVDQFPGASAVTPECVLAEAWVEANLDALPTTLEAYRDYSIPYRNAIYSALGVEARVSLWREHLRAVADEVTSPKQRRFLQTAPLEFYLGGIASESEVAAFEEEAVAILGKELTRSAFYSLGGPAPVQDGNNQLIDCSCRVGHDIADCSGGSRCYSHIWIFDLCRNVNNCGFLDLFECTGVCIYNPLDPIRNPGDPN